MKNERELFEKLPDIKAILQSGFQFNEGGQTGGRSLYFAYKAMIEAQENKG